MKVRSPNPSVIKLLYVLVIFSILCPAICRGQVRDMDNLNIKAELINPKDNSFTSLTGREMKLTTQNVIWKEGDNIQRLLIANRVYADGEAIGILYMLNPDLDAKSLKAGKEIVLPAVKNKEEFSHKFDMGFLVLLTLDNDLKQEFCSAAKELSALTAQTSALKVQQFESPDEMDNFVKTTESIIETMETFKVVILGRARPLSSDMLKQMLNEVEQAKLIIHSIINSKQKLSMSDAQTLDLIEKNMTRRKQLLVEEKGNGPGEKKLPALVQTIEQVLWNSWFEDIDDGSYVEILKPTNEYYFVLDISRFSYFKDYEAVVDPSIQKLIKETLEHGKTKIRLVIRPILHGDVLRSAENQDGSKILEKVLEIDINKLVKPKDEGVEKKIQSMHEDYKANKLPLRKFAEKVQAGEVRFKMRVDNPGDVALSISIWDQSGMIPLDHLTMSIQASDPNATEVRRSATKQTVPFRAGRSTLLDVSSDFSSTGPFIADAAFYVFEKSPSGRSIVLFATKSGAAATGAPNEVSVYAWETESLLSEYIEGRDQLIVRIKDARKKAISTNENEWKYSYQLAAGGLREKIFGGRTDKDRKQAADAESVFRELVKRKKQASIIFARMRNGEGKPVYLPLGILAANSENRFLDKRIILVQPLPREHYPSDANPVRAWTFNVPEELDELSKISNNALSQLGKDLPYHRDISTVKGYFETTEATPSSPIPEGMLLLAHQAGGNLWFTNQANGIMSEDIKHRFSAGSVAILSACSTASSEGNNQAILEKLNSNGIDAMIISPFPVDADYGAMLTIYFVEAIENAKKSSKGLSLAELFSMASQQTASYFRNVRGMHFEEMDLEFLIAGDYRIKIAPK